jgi:hypothetical protein
MVNSNKWHMKPYFSTRTGHQMPFIIINYMHTHTVLTPTLIILWPVLFNLTEVEKRLHHNLHIHFPKAAAVLP